jgi:septum formation protein
MIVLASTSSTRQGMLKSAGVLFTAVAPDVDERALALHHPHWSPAEAAMKLAEAKAVDVSGRLTDALVIGADQVLGLGCKIYAKPSSKEQCREHLSELRDRTHSLISSVVCARSGTVVWSHTAEAQLSMRPFSDRFLDHYLDMVGPECTSSVGGYKVEGPGLQLFDRVEGDYFTILGLPLIPLLAYLRSTGEILT